MNGKYEWQAADSHGIALGKAFQAVDCGDNLEAGRPVKSLL